jgi:tetratricopeptide (TPR) repeat protein
MYKLRISKWGMKKNFKRDEHEQVALRLQHFAAAGFDLPETFVDGKIVPISRVKRHFGNKLKPRLSKQKGRGRSSQTHGSSNLPHSDGGQQSRGPEIMRISLQQSSYAHGFERLLIRIHNYYGPRLCARGAVRDIKCSVNAAGSGSKEDPIDEFISTIVHMSAAYSQGYAGALKTIWNRWHLSTPCFFRKFQRSSTLLRFLVHFCSGICSHRHFYRFESLIFSHLGCLVRRTVGDEHPLSMILDLTTKETEDARGNFHVLMRLLVDLARQRGVHSKTFWRFQESYGDVLSEEADQLTVSEFYQSTLVRCKESLGEMSIGYRSLRYRLGSYYYMCGLNDEAEEIMLDLLRSRIDLNGHNETFDIDVLELLGLVYEAKGDLQAAERYIRKALPIAQSFYGDNNSTTVILATRADKMQSIRMEGESGITHFDDDEIEESVVERMMHDLSQLEISEQRENFGEEGLTWRADVSNHDTQAQEQTTSRVKNFKDGMDVPQFETVYDLEVSLGNQEFRNGCSVDAGNPQQNFTRTTSLEYNTSWSNFVVQPFPQDLSCTDALPEVSIHWNADLANQSDIDFDLNLDCLKYQQGITPLQDGAMDINMDDWITYPHEGGMESMEATMNDSWSWPASEGQISSVC